MRASIVSIKNTFSIDDSNQSKTLIVLRLKVMIKIIQIPITILTTATEISQPHITRVYHPKKWLACNLGSVR